MNGEHMICAMVLFEAETAAKQLQMQNAALQNEIERLKSGDSALKAVPPLEEKEHGPVG